ncbi:MAG: lipopolysaccharide biosynthesis protein [Proteobacteria bacterium]|nr:lipopolysaccharide biosynthesis protein [Pseudomonadota bacterium]MBU1389518.1 lipopolysaccharide biosynthesis protein [Pseudomonadota bacterium]MBU1541338.1 lipopolysaccharide biosynthesis protein [Pseudomonadota bacterium]MBU2429191.1 lipopolysaccharide biosynthesis protein [Pseudomonadota bacterium]MBU2482921.1 lipopolysaccharide biosynthesis protein [Pseudomonadota bacterium]
MKHFTAETIWVGIGVFLPTIATFVGVRLLTAAMSPDEYGRLALGISVSMGLVYSIGVGLWSTVTRFFPVAKEDGNADWYWRVIRRSLLSLSGLFVCAGLLVWLILSVLGVGFYETCFWILALIFGGIQVVGETGSALQNAARNRKIFSIHQNLMGWGRFLGAWLIIQYWIPGALGAMLGFITAAFAVMISQRYWVKKKILQQWSDTKSQKDTSKAFFNYLKPLAYTGIFIWIQLFADRWALKSFVTLEDVGIYFALYQISYAPALYCSNFLFHLLGPVFFEKAGDGHDHERVGLTAKLNERIVFFILILVLIGVGIAFWAGPYFCSLLIDSQYQKGYWAFPWLVASSGIYAVGQQFLMSVYSGVDTGMIIPFRIVTTVLAVVCYMLGGMIYGFEGIVAGGMIFSILYLCLSFLLHKQMGPPGLKLPDQGNHIPL